MSIVYSVEEINAAIEKYMDYDLIFVDTAGFSHKNEQQRSDMKKLLAGVNEEYRKEVYLVLNLVRGDLLLSGDCLSPKDVTELLKLPLLGVIPDEYAIYEGDLSRIHTSFRLLANSLTTGKKRLYDVTKKYGGFWGNVRRALKKRL